MTEIDVEEIVVVSDISEGSSSDENRGHGEGSLSEPIRSVRNCGVPPFVTKLYNIVNDKDLNSIISWVSIPNVAQMGNKVRNGATTFAIWNEVEFINKVLPLMSRSNNFDSFITQLNNYGFKKMSWDRREYANDWFQEGKPHLLKNIKSRSSKRKISQKDKMSREIKKLESESRELDHELNVFMEYIDNTMSNQKRIVQVMAKAIKSIMDCHHHACKAHEVENSDNTGQNLPFVGQHGHEMSESIFDPSCAVQVDDEPPNNVFEK